MILHDLAPGICLQYDEETSLLRAAWRRGGPLAGFVPALAQLVEFSRRHPVRHWLMSIDQLPPMGAEEQAWILEQWFPAMTTTAVEHLAMVLPADLHNRMVATTPVFNPPGPMRFELHFFLDEASAFDWLLDQHPRRQPLWDEWQRELNRRGECSAEALS